jgi:UDP-glucose 4-epimerase
VNDVVEAFILAAKSDLEGEVLNVGAGNPTSVNRLVELLGGERVFVPKRPGEPDCTFADISRIQARLGWRPRVPVEEGVRIMLENLDEFRAAPVWTPASITKATDAWFHYLGAAAGTGGWR